MQPAFGFLLGNYNLVSIYFFDAHYTQATIRFQFERQGYFYADPIDYTDAKPVFNKIVGLKDSYAKKKKAKEAPKSQAKKEQIDGEVVAMSEVEQVLFNKYTNELS